PNLKISVGINFNEADELAIGNFVEILNDKLAGVENKKQIIAALVEKERFGIAPLVKTFRSFVDVSEHDAETYMRTWSMQAYNKAAWFRTKEYAPFKEWIPTLHSERTRPSHLAMEGVIIPVDDAFKVPGYWASKNTWIDACEMMYPLDSSLGAPAGQIIQCRCTVGGRWTQKDGRKKERKSKVFFKGIL
ncbi:MAG: phage minor head protein, partial [Methanoregula sp.]|nr:phage minor head protein [Methanoregula sp.]